jgi:hypothetical protein
MDKEQAVAKLSSLIAEIGRLKGLSHSNSELTKWHRNTQIALEKIFGSNSRHIPDFNSVG